MKAKRVLSLLLCLAMLCGLMTVGTTVASAEEPELVTKILYGFEEEHAGVTTNGMYYAYRDTWTADGNTGPRTGGYLFRFLNAVAVWNRLGTKVPASALGESWVRMEIPTGLNIQGEVGYYYNAFAQNNSYYQAHGVEFADGSYYFMPYGNATTYNWDKVQFVGATLYNVSNHDDAITLTVEDFADDAENRIVALLVADAGSSDNAAWNDNYIDDVFYETVEESAETAPKATFDNGVADVEADSDGNVTLPTATIEGKQLLGWQTADGALYAAGAKVAITEDTAFTAVAADIALQTGAGIRWAQAETERGIRFETYVTKAAIDSIGSSSFELGALILPYENYQADITVENNYGALNVVDPKVYGETADGNYRYYTGVVDFERYFAVSQAAMADLKLTAVSYIKVTYADSTVGYFYDHPDATNNVRSVAEVARAALADTEFGYTDAQIAILNLYTQYSAETSTPEYRKDDADKITA